MPVDVSDQLATGTNSTAAANSPSALAKLLKAVSEGLAAAADYRRMERGGIERRSLSSELFARHYR